MSLLSGIIAKGVLTAAKNSTIKAVGSATVGIIDATARKQQGKEDVVIKNGTTFIKPTRSSENYLGKNASDIAQELLGIGFESVTLKPVNKLNDWAAKRYGKIVSISINGKSDFMGVKKVPASSYILIEYLDFKKNAKAEAYANVTPINAGTIRNASEIHSSQRGGHINNVAEAKKFCSYCGIPVSLADAKFCSNCGKPL